MAIPEMVIKGAKAKVKIRKPGHVCLFDFLTIGVYGTCWYFYINRELAELGRARGSDELGNNVTKSLLALVPGFLLVVPAVITLWNTCKRVEAAERFTGRLDTQLVNKPLGFILLALIAPVGCWYLQTHLNKVWAIEVESFSSTQVLVN